MFSRRWLINYLLFILIIIFTWIGMKYPITDQQKSKTPGIISLAPPDVSSIRIETADSSFELSKQDSRWMLTNPVQWFANNVSAERLATLATIEPQSTLPRQDIDLSTLGLTIPRAVVTLNQQAIFFGDTNQIGNRRYLMVDPNVHLVSDVHYPFFSQGLPALIDKRLLPASLDLQSLNAPTFNIERKENDWVSADGKYDTERVKTLINHWQTKQASSIQPYDKALTPLHKVKAHSADAGAIEFYVLSIKPEIIIARPDLGIQFHFADPHYYDLLSLDKVNE